MPRRQALQAHGNPDGASMEPALWALVRAPERALPLLKQRLQAGASPERLQKRMIGQLDRVDFKVRDAACAAKLTAMAHFAIPACAIRSRKASHPSSSAAASRTLLARLEDPVAIPSCLRELRANEVLERIGLRGSAQDCRVARRRRRNPNG